MFSERLEITSSRAVVPALHMLLTVQLLTRLPVEVVVVFLVLRGSKLLVARLQSGQQHPSAVGGTGLGRGTAGLS